MHPFFYMVYIFIFFGKGDKEDTPTTDGAREAKEGCHGQSEWRDPERHSHPWKRSMGGIYENTFSDERREKFTVDRALKQSTEFGTAPEDTHRLEQREKRQKARFALPRCRAVDSDLGQIST